MAGDLVLNNATVLIEVATVNVHGSSVEVLQRLDQIAVSLTTLQQQGEAEMSTLDEVLADVQAEGTQIDSLSVLTAGLKQQLADALAGVTLPADVQAKVDAVFSGVEANKQKVVDAINANSPPPPVPPVPPVPATP